jgi:hypothetical protein
MVVKKDSVNADSNVYPKAAEGPAVAGLTHPHHTLGLFSVNQAKPPSQLL